MTDQQSGPECNNKDEQNQFDAVHLEITSSCLHVALLHAVQPNSFIPGSKLTFSANLFHHSLLAPTWTAFSDYTGPDLTLLNGFSFLVIFFLFLGVRAVN